MRDKLLTLAAAANSIEAIQSTSRTLKPGSPQEWARIESIGIPDAHVSPDGRKRSRSDQLSDKKDKDNTTKQIPLSATVITPQRPEAKCPNDLTGVLGTVHTVYRPKALRAQQPLPQRTSSAPHEQQPASSQALAPCIDKLPAAPPAIHPPSPPPARVGAANPGLKNPPATPADPAKVVNAMEVSRCGLASPLLSDPLLLSAAPEGAAAPAWAKPIRSSDSPSATQLGGGRRSPVQPTASMAVPCSAVQYPVASSARQGGNHPADCSCCPTIPAPAPIRQQATGCMGRPVTIQGAHPWPAAERELLSAWPGTAVPGCTAGDPATAGARVGAGPVAPGRCFRRTAGGAPPGLDVAMCETSLPLPLPRTSEPAAPEEAGRQEPPRPESQPQPQPQPLQLPAHACEPATTCALRTARYHAAQACEAPHGCAAGHGVYGGKLDGGAMWAPASPPQLPATSEAAAAAAAVSCDAAGSCTGGTHPQPHKRAEDALHEVEVEADAPQGLPYIAPSTAEPWPLVRVVSAGSSGHRQLYYTYPYPYPYPYPLHPAYQRHHPYGRGPASHPPGAPLARPASAHGVPPRPWNPAGYLPARGVPFPPGPAALPGYLPLRYYGCGHGYGGAAPAAVDRRPVVGCHHHVDSAQPGKDPWVVGPYRQAPSAELDPAGAPVEVEGGGAEETRYVKRRRLTAPAMPPPECAVEGHDGEDEAHPAPPAVREAGGPTMASLGQVPQHLAVPLPAMLQPRLQPQQEAQADGTEAESQLWGSAHRYPPHHSGAPCPPCPVLPNGHHRLPLPLNLRPYPAIRPPSSPPAHAPQPAVRPGSGGWVRVLRFGQQQQQQQQPSTALLPAATVGPNVFGEHDGNGDGYGAPGVLSRAGCVPRLVTRSGAERCDPWGMLPEGGP